MPNCKFRLEAGQAEGERPLVLKGCVEWARENDCELITAKEMQIINDKRAKEKNKK